MGTPVKQWPKAALDRVLARLYGGHTREDATSIAVGLTRVTASERDPERVTLVFMNLGTTVIFVAPTPLVSTTLGFRLGPSGGLVAMDVWEDAHAPTLEWFAIGDLAGGTLFRLSIRRETLFPGEDGAP